MNRLALALLAVAALLGALFLLAPWKEDADLDPAEFTAEHEEGGPGEALAGGGDAKKGEELTSGSGETAPDRKEVDTAKIRVAGRLVGDVAPGTVVHLYFGKARSSSYWPGVQTNQPNKDPDGVARTDAQGRFQFRIPLDKEGRVSLPSGALVWSKRPPRFLGSKQDLDLGDLPVHKGAILRGHVLSTNDAPIADARLQFVNYENFQIGPRVTQSDSVGAFTLQGLPAGDAYVTVSCKGHMGRYVRVELERGKVREQFVVRMSRGETLHGQVVDDRSQPVVGATVNVHGNGRSTKDGGYEYGNGNAKTDAKGEFRVEGISAGPFNVSAQAKGHLSHNRSKVSVVDGPIRIELTRMGVVTGRITDEAGAPMVASRVHATHKDPLAKAKSRGSAEPTFSLELDLLTHGESVYSRGSRGGVKTDEEGKFTLENIKPGKVWLVANGGHREAVFGPIEVVSGSQVDAVEIRAERGAVVLVRVVDPDGDPLAKVSVTVTAASKAKQPAAPSGQFVNAFAPHGGSMLMTRFAGGRKKSKSGTTDDKGEVEIAGLEPGEYTVSARHKSFVTPKSRSVAVKAKGREKTELAMEAGGTAEVRVKDHRGKPVAEQNFRVVFKPVAAAAPGAEKDKKTKKKSGPSRTGRTDSTGRATVGPLAAGRYEAHLRHTPGGAAAAMGMWGFYNASQQGKEIGARVEFVVKPNESVEVVLIRPKMGTVLGTVSDASGPIRNGVLSLSPKPEKSDGRSGGYSRMVTQTQRARSDGSGAFRFEGLQPGTYVLSVRRKKGQLPFLEEVVVGGPGEHRKDVFLVAGEIELELLLDGKPEAGVVVTVSSVRANPYVGMFMDSGNATRNNAGSSDEKGVVLLTGIPPGEYRVRFGGRKFLQPKSSDHLVVERGGSAKKRFALQRAAGLKIVAEATSGSPKVTMFRVELTKEGEAKPTKRQWIHGGSGTIGSLTPGRYTVRAMRRDQRPTPTPNAKAATWSAPQTIVLESGKVPTVKVVLP